MRRLVSWVVPLLLLLGIATSAAADPISIFNFSGTCSDCTGTATGQLTLSNYTPGDDITSGNFVSFHYHGTDLLAAFTVVNGSDITVSGKMNAPFPAPENFSLIGATFATTFISSSGGSWCTGFSCTDDFGATHVWSAAVAPDVVPEPLPLSLMAGGVLVGWVVRRKRR